MWSHAQRDTEFNPEVVCGQSPPDKYEGHFSSADSGLYPPAKRLLLLLLSQPSLWAHFSTHSNTFLSNLPAGYSACLRSRLETILTTPTCYFGIAERPHQYSQQNQPSATWIFCGLAPAPQLAVRDDTAHYCGWFEHLQSSSPWGGEPCGHSSNLTAQLSIINRRLIFQIGLSLRHAPQETDRLGWVLQSAQGSLGRSFPLSVSSMGMGLSIET